MTIGWPLRIVLVLGVIFFIQSVWSISSVRFTPLPVNRDMPKFSDIPLEMPAELRDRDLYRNPVRAAFEHVKDGCTPDALREFAHAVTFFYIDAVENARRVGVTRIVDSPGWALDDQKIDNYVAALLREGILRPEHFPSNVDRADGRIPFFVEGAIPQVYPEWAEPPLTLGCARG